MDLPISAAERHAAARRRSACSQGPAFVADLAPDSAHPPVRGLHNPADESLDQSAQNVKELTELAKVTTVVALAITKHHSGRRRQ